jgi:hypothetical protein
MQRWNRLSTRGDARSGLEGIVAQLADATVGTYDEGLPIAFGDRLIW